MTLSLSLKVTQHIICIPSYSSFWSLWSTDKQQPRSWCLAHLKICLLQHTLQLRHLGSEPSVRSKLSKQEAPGRGSEATQALVQISQPAAHWFIEHPVAASTLQNSPLPPMGQACALHLSHTGAGTFGHHITPSNWSTECKLFITWHKQMQLFQLGRKDNDLYRHGWHKPISLTRLPPTTLFTAVFFSFWVSVTAIL